ncbi:MAG: hypothetical protein C5B49_11055 [Bdellovibrio sp.]|nr:MAG: hypothetical protein C5B49_11055 [Bdellovibrio sp.]
MQESHWRSLLKGLSWRVGGSLATVFIAWIFTDDFRISLEIGGVELLSKVFLYYIHERLWLQIPWGVGFASAAHAGSSKGSQAKTS